MILVAHPTARESLQKELADETVVILTLKEAKASNSSLVTGAPHAQPVVSTRARQLSEHLMVQADCRRVRCVG